jgi:D-beta-D-heptose 7-phosphate kinase/D-beta-D-heptose 1-phosphate adenosyltransferase
MGKKSVFTNGCFDILHRGHIELLKYCETLGDVIVGLNSDESIRRLKGDRRPVNSQDDRKALLQAIKYVDRVIIFEEDTPYNLIKKTTPDIIVKGGDYKKEEVIGSDLCEVIIFNYLDGYSTTKTIEGITSGR